MSIRQSEKQRLSSLEIERRFPTISDKDIRNVYLNSISSKKKKATKNEFTDNLVKNIFVMNHIRFKDKEIQGKSVRYEHVRSSGSCIKSRNS